MDHQKLIFFLVSLISTLVLAHGHTLPIVHDDNRTLQTYIVDVRKPQGAEFLGDQDLEDWHRSFLPNTTLDSGEPRLVYSYREAISGFAALLTREEVAAMELKEGFLHAEPERVVELGTTHTYSVLGLGPGSSMWVDASEGSGVIIGVVDTGAQAAHPSFKDNGMPPIPKTWKVHCEYKQPKLCNKKIISAQAFKGKAKVPPSDKDDGHGTHVAGIAAGSSVYGANVLGNAMGTAIGMAPKAHLSIYKVGHKKRIVTSDVVAGMNAAIVDKVDLISISLYSTSLAMKDDLQGRAAFAALKKNILTVACAGNLGPDPSVIGNDAPWYLTVGAATTDRRIKATVKLGSSNQQELDGETGWIPQNFPSKPLPIAFPGYNGNPGTLGCKNDSFIGVNVTGKVVLCGLQRGTFPDKAKFVKAAGGIAMILINTYWEGGTTYANPYVLPTVHLGNNEAQKLVDYYDITLQGPDVPVLSISFKGTQFGARPTPAVATFSGRGPSLGNGGILKPDVIAPGVNILSAYPFQVGPNATNSSKSAFNFESGTSMATPHVSGIAALLKKLHPLWSPAAIKSAIMTTAYTLDRSGNNITDEFEYKDATHFAMGAGHVDPLEARDPGLVYDAGPSDYIPYLCGLGYTDVEVELIIKQKFQCSTIQSISAEQLNYPSISVSLGPNKNNVTVKRTVTNVGEANSNYTVQVDEPEGVTVDFSPNELLFTSIDEQQSFNVTFTLKATHPNQGKASDGQFSWSSHNYDVRSAIVVTFT